MPLPEIYTVTVLIGWFRNETFGAVAREEEEFKKQVLGGGERTFLAALSYIC